MQICWSNLWVHYGVVVVVNALPVLVRELPSKYAPKSALVVTTGQCACEGLRQHPKAPESVVRWELQAHGLRSVSTCQRTWARLQEFQDEGVLRVLLCLGWKVSASIGPTSNEDEASVRLDPVHQCFCASRTAQ